MIAISLTTALALYSGLLLLLAFGIWTYTDIVTYRMHRILGKQYMWRCVFCGIAYLDESGRTLSACPRCGSFNSIADKHAREAPQATPGAPDRSLEHDASRAPAGTSKRKRPRQRRRGPRRRSR